MSFHTIQLSEILSTPRNQRAIAWLPHGKAFMILNRDHFVSDILPNYLGKSTKYTSFTRKLSRWKFQRVQCGPEEGAWIHEVSKLQNRANKTIDSHISTRHPISNLFWACVTELYTRRSFQHDTNEVCKTKETNKKNQGLSKVCPIEETTC